MRWILVAIGAAAIIGSSGVAYVASTQGWGLPGLIDQPVSIRDSSVSRDRRGASPMLLYFATRRHRGGGFGYGK